MFKYLLSVTWIIFFGAYCSAGEQAKLQKPRIVNNKMKPIADIEGIDSASEKRYETQYGEFIERNENGVRFRIQKIKSKNNSIKEIIWY